MTGARCWSGASLLLRRLPWIRDLVHQKEQLDHDREAFHARVNTFEIRIQDVELSQPHPTNLYLQYSDFIDDALERVDQQLRAHHGQQFPSPACLRGRLV